MAEATPAELVGRIDWMLRSLGRTVDQLGPDAMRTLDGVVPYPAEFIALVGHLHTAWGVNGTPITAQPRALPQETSSTENAQPPAAAHVAAAPPPVLPAVATTPARRPRRARVGDAALLAILTVAALGLGAFIASQDDGTTDPVVPPPFAAPAQCDGMARLLRTETIYTTSLLAQYEKAVTLALQGNRNAAATELLTVAETSRKLRTAEARTAARVKSCESRLTALETAPPQQG